MHLAPPIIGPVCALIRGCGQLILRENGQNRWHQMSDFNAKMHHQIWFQLTLPPDLLAAFKGAYISGKKGKVKERGEERR